MRRSGCGTARGCVAGRWKSCPNYVQSWFRFSCRCRRSSTSSSASSVSSGSPARWISSRRSVRSSAVQFPSRPVAEDCRAGVSRTDSASPDAVHSGEPGDQDGLPSRIQSRGGRGERGARPRSDRSMSVWSRWAQEKCPPDPTIEWALFQQVGEPTVTCRRSSGSGGESILLDPSRYLDNHLERLSIPVPARISQFLGRVLSPSRTIFYGSGEDRTASFHAPC